MKRLMILVALSLAFTTACSDSNEAPKDAGQDATSDAGGPDASCFTNPTTNYEIINACTTAQKIYKNPVLPLLNPDGSLPPLP